MGKKLKGKLYFSNIFKLVHFFAAGVLGIALLCCSLLYSQQIDPFYPRQLREGETLFLAQDYKEAIKTLEIAAFGLHREKKLLGKAYVYLSLSHYYLKNYEDCEHYLRKAVELGGEEGFESLDLKMEEHIRSDLEKLIDHFKLRKKEEKKEPEKVLKKPPEAEPKIKKPLKKEEIEHIQELEKSIKAQPRNVSLYYELYELHRENNNLKAAKKVLESLVKKNPNEVKAFRLLGLINFQGRKYKDASKNFEQILKLSKRVQIDETLLLETKVNLTLCYKRHRETKKIRDLVSKSISSFSEEKINSLSLDEKDKDEFLKIVANFRAQVVREREKIQIKNLENTLKKEPQNISLYYELYDLHRKHRNVKAAKKVIQTLVKNNPDELSGFYFLAKIEFFQKNYKEALKGFNKVLKPTEEIQIENELLLKSLIYFSLCLYHLDRKEHLDSFIRIVKDSLSEEKLKRMLKEEGLEEEWEKIVKGEEGEKG